MLEVIMMATLAGIGYYLSNEKSRTGSEGFVGNAFPQNSPYPSASGITGGSSVTPGKTEMRTPAASDDTTQYVESLSGDKIPVSQFKHSNQQPFFRGSSKQNTFSGANQQILDTHMGGGALQYHKRETAPLFDMERDTGNVFGTPNRNDFFTDRMVPSAVRNNERPFRQVTVGPGLDKGYTACPSGGFHQQDARDKWLPRNVDELRVATNPKLTYKGRDGGPAGDVYGGARGIVGRVEKNNPDTFFVNSPDRYFTSTTNVQETAARPEQVIRDVNRTETTREYFTPAGPTATTETYVPGQYRDANREALPGYGFRNLAAPDAWTGNGAAVPLPCAPMGCGYVGGTTGDYGKQGVEIRPNERALTESRTYLSNFASIVRALTTPIADLLKTTRKENAIGNLRQAGNVHIAGPKQLPAYDPNDVARATIKETTIDNINPTGYYASTQSGFGYIVRGVAAPPTHKQTIATQPYVGAPNGGVTGRGGYGHLTTNAYANPTQRQTTHVDYTGGAQSSHPTSKSYMDAYNARLNTTKTEVSQGRQPLGGNTHIFSGPDAVHIKVDKVESDRVNTRTCFVDKTWGGSIPSKEHFGSYDHKCPVQQDVHLERNSPHMVAAFAQNPYTHSLTNAVPLHAGMVR